MFWFDKSNTDVVFGDIRRESHILCDGRSLVVNPDVVMDFTALPYTDGAFKLVCFDPPHLDNCGPRGWQGLKYGKLPKEWRAYLQAGFAECFRVLADDGVLVFKWNETRIKSSSVLGLTPHRPLFGQQTGRGARTHWYVFMKPHPSAC
jgi:hypothetical protein